MSLSTFGRLALVSAGALTATLALAIPASADPKREVVPLDCGDAGTFNVAVNGNGAFAPGHLTNSTSMLIPVAFGEFHGVVTDEEGNVLDDFTDPAVTKGNTAGKANVECTFSFSETFEDPEFGIITFTGSGSVQGFLTPRRH